ncbi:RNA-binding protein 7 isoform X2 [Nilaparvata lugens]|uniref:RNA-binding protein 7 isoform X2 n=1 Tax=Nilaparvata lugens TaxID=108931 RepID=UPI00193CFA49|nr:RNA-binding protein 7 isoform X2 [Nilaparvata lugens]
MNISWILLLFQQPIKAGPVEEVSLPKKPDGSPKQFAFILFKQECSVIYAKELFETTRLFGNPLRIEPKMKDAADRVREQVEKLPDVNGLNVLRGFGGDRRNPSLEDELSRRQTDDGQRGAFAPPNFEQLLQMGQQLQQSIPSFRTMINQPNYYQQSDLSMMPDHRRRGADHHQARNRHVMHHPYRDERPPRSDQRHNQHGGGRYHQYGGHHQRERKGRRH